jgi:hypothetical protein
MEILPYVAGAIFSIIVIMLLGELLGIVVDLVTPARPDTQRPTDEDAVDHRFYRDNDWEDY